MSAKKLTNFILNLIVKKKPLEYSKGLISMCSVAVTLAPPIIQSCNTISSFNDPLALDDIRFSFIKNIKVSF